MRRLKSLTAVGGVAVALTGLSAPPIAAAAPGGFPATSLAATSLAATSLAATSLAASPDRVRTVTLVTGDRVSVTTDEKGQEQVGVVPAPGHAGEVVRVVRIDGDTYVLPARAERAVAAGLVDRRLFDVSDLLRSGYDDARRATLPVIVEYAQGAAATTARSASGLRAGRDLGSVGMAAAQIDKASATQLWREVVEDRSAGLRTTAGTKKVSRIWLDALAQPVLDRSVKQIGVPAAWSAGLTGRGVRVAVLDSGVDANHPDLAGKVTSSRSFVEGITDTGDPVGHGTHVASTIAGSGAASGGRYRGVAPDATLLNGKVCSLQGCPTSAIIAGMEWAATTERADVINMSLGGGDFPGIDPMERAVNTLSRTTGALFVVAAGNSGPRPATVSSPGSAEQALTVGAVDRDGTVAPFSSRGPTYGAPKPDVTAPGVDIVAARAAGSSLGEPVGEHYMTLSGTSMATPHVAGAAALLAQKLPAATGRDLKALLSSSATPNPASTVYDQGAGLIDVARALDQTLTGTGALDFGEQTWPRTDDTPVVRTLSYTNRSAAPLTVNLELQAGAARLWSLSTRTLTVPAGATRTATLTANSRHAGRGRTVSTTVTATAGTQRVVTSAVLRLEAESYDVSVAFLDRSGGTPGLGDAAFTSLDGRVTAFIGGLDGVDTLRLPAGHYRVVGTIVSGDYRSAAVLVEQDLSVTQAGVKVTFDARTARPVTYRLADSGPTPSTASVVYRDPALGMLSAIEGAGLGSLFVDPRPFTGGPESSQSSQVVARWRSSSSAGPVVSVVERTTVGRFPAGETRTFEAGDFGTVTNTIAARAAGQRAFVGIAAVAGRSTNVVNDVEVALPATVTYRVASDANPAWQTTVEIYPKGETGYTDQVQVLVGQRLIPRGSQSQDAWNTGPFGPALRPSRGAPLVRKVDVLSSNLVMLFSDRAGHIGWLPSSAVSWTVRQDGELLGEVRAAQWFIPVSPTPATYTVDVVAKNSVGLAGLPSTVTTSWTFRSERAPDWAARPVPVLAARFLPTAAADGSVQAGAASVPLLLQSASGRPVTGAKITSLELSTDGGSTWAKVALSGAGDRPTAAVTHQAGTTVSWRVKAVGDDGVRLVQTVLGAYPVRAAGVAAGG